MRKNVLYAIAIIAILSSCSNATNETKETKKEAEMTKPDSSSKMSAKKPFTEVDLDSVNIHLIEGCINSYAYWRANGCGECTNSSKIVFDKPDEFRKWADKIAATNTTTKKVEVTFGYYDTNFINTLNPTHADYIDKLTVFIIAKDGTDGYARDASGKLLPVFNLGSVEP